ncbi:acetyl-CoA synthetase-like protein [Linnemannia elongata AG-77]|uniref:Acetyl-CoA synthetase-like protein n=1 Tax=Linnemannia elongata AG-77 TaxID=1314771 RepID=A0A197K3Z5_9FUNG|nr:acetyl-CoA synthetase-like protein [Linnemannia elongata AG-77]
MPGLKIIISMDSLNPPTDLKTANVASSAGFILHTFAADKGIQLYDWDEVGALGRSFTRAHSPPKPQDPIIICYISGMTGQPKGAILTYANFVTVVAASEISHILTPSEAGISYLPMAHVFGRAMEIFLYSTGGRIGRSTGDPLRILEDISVLQPTFFPTVSRLFNRIYARVYTLTAGAPGFAGAMARRALAVKLANLKAGLGNKACILGPGDTLKERRHQHSAEKWKQPTSRNSTKSQPTDKPYPRGEICVRGPNVFPGYLKDEEKTREAIDDEGWLHSGDIGFIKENGTSTVIGRMNNVFKQSRKIEYPIASRLPIALQLFVHGDSHEPCLVPIFVLDLESFPAFANNVIFPSGARRLAGKIDGTFRSACQDPKLRRAMLQEFTLAAQ